MNARLKSGYKYKEHKIEHKTFGSTNSIGGQPITYTGQWLNWIPTANEQQDVGFSDPEDCTSYGTLNAIQTLATAIYNDQTSYSPRYLAYISGTTTEGNDPMTVVEALGNKGAVPFTDWPIDATLNSWSAYYAMPPIALATKALEFKAQYALDKEWVGTDPQSLMLALQYSPLGVAGYAWAQNDQGLYYTPAGEEPCHWFVLIGFVENQYWIAFDSYSQDVKHLTWDYVFSEAMRYSLTKQVSNPTAWEQFLSFMHNLLGL